MIVKKLSFLLLTCTCLAYNTRSDTGRKMSSEPDEGCGCPTGASPESLIKIVTTQMKIMINDAIDSVTLTQEKNSTNQLTINDGKQYSMLCNIKHNIGVVSEFHTSYSNQTINIRN